MFFQVPAFHEECRFEMIIGGCSLYPIGVDPIVRPADIEYDIDLSVRKGGIDLRNIFDRGNPYTD